MKCLNFAAALVILGALALAGTASATTGSTVLTTETGGEVETPTIHLVNESGHVLLHNPEANIECASTATVTPTSHGEEEPVSGPVSSLSFSGCTGGWQVTTNSAGSMGMEYTSGHNGSVSSDGATLTATLNLIFFHVTCRYKTEDTPIGTLTGGNPATLHIEASVPFHSGSGLCGTEPSAWTGNYTTTGALFVGQGGMELDPFPEMVFEKVNEKKIEKIKNTGTVLYKNLKVELQGKGEGFKLKGTCNNTKLGAGKTCEEEIECIKANEPQTLAVIGENVGILQGFILLDC